MTTLASSIFSSNYFVQNNKTQHSKNKIIRIKEDIITSKRTVIYQCQWLLNAIGFELYTFNIENKNVIHRQHNFYFFSEKENLLHVFIKSGKTLNHKQVFAYCNSHKLCTATNTKGKHNILDLAYIYKKYTI